MGKDDEWLKKVLSQFNKGDNGHSVIELAFSIHHFIDEYHKDKNLSLFDIIGSLEAVKTIYNCLIINSFNGEMGDFDGFEG